MLVRELRLTSYRNKSLQAGTGQFLRSTEDVRDSLSWDWLKGGILKKKTEGLLTAAQDQALQTNYIKNKIDRQDVSPMCHQCGEREETVSHISGEYKKIS